MQRYENEFEQTITWRKLKQIFNTFVNIQKVSGAVRVRVVI